MLKDIPSIISPELMKALMQMGLCRFKLLMQQFSEDLMRS